MPVVPLGLQHLAKPKRIEVTLMAANRGCDVPSAGISYPITLGDTLLSDKASHSYCSLRYDFKPASAGRFRQGSVTMQDNQASALPPAILLPCFVLLPERLYIVENKRLS